MWKILSTYHLKKQNNIRKYTFITLNDLLENERPVKTNRPPSCTLDNKYPGTADSRMQTIRDRVKNLKEEQLGSDWNDVRQLLLWAGGLKNTHRYKSVALGDTARFFNDFNHCDIIAVKEDFATLFSDDLEGRVDPTNSGLIMSVASVKDLGPGLSWCTCMVGCNENPPKDVAHLHYKARIAFKLVWVPSYYKSFVLVDNNGDLLNKGTPKGQLPDFFERQHNYKVVAGSKYAKAAVTSLQWDIDVASAVAAATTGSIE